MSKLKFNNKGLVGLFAILAVGVAGYFSYQSLSTDGTPVESDSSSAVESQSAESTSETPEEVPALQVKESQTTIQND